jgi:hypothetical protein
VVNKPKQCKFDPDRRRSSRVLGEGSRSRKIPWFLYQVIAAIYYGFPLSNSLKYKEMENCQGLRRVLYEVEAL